MAFSSGSRSGLSYVVESTFGTTPGTPALLQLPYTSESLNLTKEVLQGNDLLPDRMARTNRQGNRNVAGDIVVDLRSSVYDTFLESGMLSTWTGTNSRLLKVGTTPKYFSIEDAAEDITQYRLFTGCTVNTMAFSIKTNQMVTTTFGIVGKDMTVSGTSVDPTKTAAADRYPFDSYSGNLQLATYGGSLADSAVITGVDFTVTNNFSPSYVIGTDSTPGFITGNSVVEGSITAYFENAGLINRFLNETETQMEITVSEPSGAKDYAFFFPRFKVNSADTPVSGPGERIVTINFVAIYDSVEGTTLKITRPITP